MKNEELLTALDDYGVPLSIVQELAQKLALLRELEAESATARVAQLSRLKSLGACGGCKFLQVKSNGALFCIVRMANVYCPPACEARATMPESDSCTSCRWSSSSAGMLFCVKKVAQPFARTKCGEFEAS